MAIVTLAREANIGEGLDTPTILEAEEEEEAEALVVTGIPWTADLGRSIALQPARSKENIGLGTVIIPTGKRVACLKEKQSLRRRR